jgi:hypothetical protein
MFLNQIVAVATGLTQATTKKAAIELAAWSDHAAHYSFGGTVRSHATTASRSAAVMRA